jgi:hypothetical protein
MFILLLLFACTAPDDAGDTAAADTGDSLAPIVQYLHGAGQYSDTSGTPRGDPSEVLLRRTIDPADGSLEELVVTVDGTDVETYTLLGTIDPDAGTWTFSFTDAYGTFDGEGTFLAGDTWAWTQWTSTSTYVDGPYAGSYVVSEDTLDDAGLVANKAVYAPDDAAEGTIVETLDLVSQADWDTRRAEIAPE